MARQIKRIFLNVNMANRFDGLQKITIDAGIKLSELTQDSYVIFVNSGRDKIAMLVGPQLPKQRQVMTYTKLEAGRKIDLRAIVELPRVFDGKSINYDKALELAMEKALKKKAAKTIEMV